MTLERLRELCLSLPGAHEKMPFASFPSGADILCFYIGPKIFCLTDIGEFEAFNLKVTPEDNVELCERYMSVNPGHHMNKQHWITVHVPGDVPVSVIEGLVRQSYKLVFATLPKKTRDALVK